MRAKPAAPSRLPEHDHAEAVFYGALLDRGCRAFAACAPLDFLSPGRDARLGDAGEGEALFRPSGHRPGGPRNQRPVDEEAGLDFDAGSAAFELCEVDVTEGEELAGGERFDLLAVHGF